MNSDASPNLSICMIVRNEARRIGVAVERHASLADEIVVVDTGSTDGTSDIARDRGARVAEFAWSDDFAAARNASLEAAGGRWALIIDPDEWIAQADFHRLREICANPSLATAYSLTTRTYSNNCSLIDWRADANPPVEARETNGFYVSTKVRLFPRLSHVRFTGIVHELVEPSLQHAGIAIEHLGVIIHHLPEENTSPEHLRRKREHYLCLSRKKAAESPNDAKALCELGMIAFETEHFPEAADALARAMEMEPGDSEAALLCAAARIRMGDFAGARDLLLSHLDLFPRSAESRAMLGEAYDNLREPRLAEKYYLEALAIRPDYPHLLIVLGNLFMGTSRAAQALACFEHAARVNPQNEIATANAGIVLAAMGKLDESRARFETSRRLNPGLWLSHYYLGQIAEAEGRRTEARELYERALKLDPANPRIKTSLAQLGAD